MGGTVKSRGGRGRTGGRKTWRDRGIGEDRGEQPMSRFVRQGSACSLHGYDTTHKNVCSCFFETYGNVPVERESGVPYYFGDNV